MPRSAGWRWSESRGEAPARSSWPSLFPTVKHQHDALAEHCRAKLPSERWPDRVFYAQSLPRAPGGKVDRGQIKQIAINETQRQLNGQPPTAAQQGSLESK